MAHRPNPVRPGGTGSAAVATRKRGASRSALGVGVAGLALALLQAAWLGWFLWEPLPNAANLGGTVRRWMFLARALPYVIPGVTPDQSYFGMALGELRHVENLPQRVPLVLAATLIGGAAVGLGGLALRALGLARTLGPLERFPLSFGLGAPLLSVVTLLCGRLGWLAPWPVRLALAALVLTEAIGLARDAARAPKGHPGDGPGFTPLAWGALLALVGPFLVMMALGAMLPTVDFDAIEYHLQGPKEYFQAGRVAFLPHNVYTSMPFGVEMLHLLGMEVTNDWRSGALVGQLLIAAHAPLAALFVALTARRWGSPRAAWFAALVYLTTPWVYRLGVLPYVEGPLCFYQAALLWAAGRAWDETDPTARTRRWAAAGWLAGGAMACKYPALLSAVLPFGAVAAADLVRRRSPSSVVAYALGVALVMTPWLAKNVIDTGNPVYPLGYGVFGGRYWDAAMDAKWGAAHGPRPVSGALLRQSAVDVAGRSDWQSPLYLALGPLALVRPGSRKFAAAVAGFVAYLFLSWWLFTHRLDRFWLPLLPAAAVLAGLGADLTWFARARAWDAWLAVLVGLALVTNLAYTSTALTGLNEWTGDLTVLQRSVPRMLNPPLARLDAELPAEAKVLLVGQAAVFHLEHPIAYNTVFDDETFETLAKGRTPAEVRAALSRLGVTHVYVDWYEIERYRSPGNYGFTPFVTRAELDRLVKAGVLDRPVSYGAKQEAYRVRAGNLPP